MKVYVVLEYDKMKDAVAFVDLCNKWMKYGPANWAAKIKPVGLYSVNEAEDAERLDRVPLAV